MGVAIIVPGAGFDDTYGKVTLVGTVSLKSLAIVAEDSYVGDKAQLAVMYTPINATARNVAWSIVSGGAYATIDQNGLLTIGSGASASDVTVRVASVSDNTVYAEKTVTLTYDAPVHLLEKVSISGAPTLNTGCVLSDGTDSVEMKYKVTGAPGHQGTLWGALNEHTAVYADDSINIAVDFLADGVDNSITKGTVRVYRQATQVGNLVEDEFFLDHATRNGVDMTYYYGYAGTGIEQSNDIYILSPEADYAFGGIDVHHFKIKRNGVVTHDFRAAEKGGVYGFQDIITNTFIHNTGNTGTITA